MKTAGLASHPRLLDAIVERIGVGILVVDQELRVILWNRFMESHSGLRAVDLIGRNLIDACPDLPAQWLEKKIQSVWLLKNFAFTSWEQRPFLFRFRHNRPVTGGVEYMRQNCTFQPLIDPGGEVFAVCITIFDVTDASVYHQMLKASLAEVKELSIRDGLTGLFNRRSLEHHLEREFKRYRRYGGALSLIMFDIDAFKGINDAHGHLVGDEVLREVACRVQDRIRATDFAGRYGGEEFAIVLANTRLAGAVAFAERLRRAMADHPVVRGDVVVPVTVSVGVCEADDKTADYADLIEHTDAALYRAKHGGRDRVVAHAP